MANSAATLHPAGTVMLSRTASVGYSVIVGRPMATTQAFVTWTAGPRLDPRYLLLVLRAMKPEWERLAYGSTHLTIYMPDLESLRIPLPPLHEQRQISDLVAGESSALDVIQTATSRQLELLRERFLESLRVATTLGWDSELVATGIPWMPTVGSRSKLYKIGRVFRTGSGTTPRSTDPEYFDGEISWINTADLRDGVVSSPVRKVSRAAIRDYPSLRVYPPGALIVAMYGATVGRVGMNSLPAAVNQACCVLSEHGELSVEYAFYWFIAHRSRIVSLASGGGQPNISQDLVRSLRISAPDSRRAQREVTEYCAGLADAFEGQVCQLTKRLDLLRERRQALISSAVTGQVDFSNVDGVLK